MRHLIAFVALLLLTACRVGPTEPLAVAAAAGDLKKMQTLLSAKSNVNANDAEGLSALVWAARSGQPDAIRLLIKSGANPNALDDHNGWTPLVHAVHKKQVGAAVALIESGANPDLATSNGTWTPLVMASAYGDVAMIDALMKQKASSRVALKDGTTPLRAAVEGSADIDDFTVGSCQEAAVKAILRADPAAPIGTGTVKSPCSAVSKLIGRETPNAKRKAKTEG